MALRILLITGGDPAGHPFHKTAPLTRDILTSSFDVVEETELGSIKNGNRLKEFRGIVLHGRFPGRDEDAEAGFERFVHGGNGLVVIHIASSSFEGSARWRKLLGRVWEYGPKDDFNTAHPFTSDHPSIGAFRVDITNPVEQITSGLKNFIIERDERYQDLVIAPNVTIHVLATATLVGRTEPIAWMLIPPQGGRVFHITIGHDPSTYKNKSFQELLKRA